jgi:hypothetical protein
VGEDGGEERQWQSWRMTTYRALKKPNLKNQGSDERKRQRNGSEEAVR